MLMAGACKTLVTSALLTKPPLFHLLPLLLFSGVHGFLPFQLNLRQQTVEEERQQDKAVALRMELLFPCFLLRMAQRGGADMQVISNSLP